MLLPSEQPVPPLLRFCTTSLFWQGLSRAHHIQAISHGSLAALAMRMVLVVMGAALLQRFSWLLLAVASLLLVTGMK